jgi:hypothetical protein
MPPSHILREREDMSTGEFFKFPRMSRRLHAGPLVGHESVEATQIHLHAHLALNEAALPKATPLNGKQARFRPPDKLLRFLNDP